MGSSIVQYILICGVIDTSNQYGGEPLTMNPPRFVESNGGNHDDQKHECVDRDERRRTTSPCCSVRGFLYTRGWDAALLT